MKQSDMTGITWRIVSRAVPTLEVNNYPDFFDIFDKKERNFTPGTSFNCIRKPRLQCKLLYNKLKLTTFNCESL